MRCWRLLLSMCSVSLALGSPAFAILINNGLAPPNPQNVIDHFLTSDVFDTVDVHDRFCTPSDDCSNPSGPTTVAIVDGGVASNVLVYGNSHVDMSGGEVHGLYLAATDDASIIMSGGVVHSILEATGRASIELAGGYVDFQVRADDSSYLAIAGGTIGGSSIADIRVLGSALIEIFGSDFAIDGIPVGFGDVSALTGQLTGTLGSGELIDNDFEHVLGAGTIRLMPIPEPGAGLLLAAGLIALARRR